jgi:thioredoxin reductase
VLDGHSIADTFTKAQMQEYIESACNSALELKKLGFQMFSFHNAYRGGPGAQLWSPLCNHRHDEYGVDTVENRARFLLDLFDALKSTLGRDFPLEVLISGTEPGGVTIADTIELARLLEGKVDILSIRNGVQDPQHPTGFTSTRDHQWPNEEVTTAVTQSVHARGGKLLIGATAGLHDADLCESIIAEGKADVIGMARSWICDSEYGEKLYEGRGEDITPCVRCNKCHVPNDTDKYRSFCTVNPLIGLEDKIDRMVKPVTRKKKVAVVGGGPSGMYAAITCAERGHDVTLYEKEAILGGQLIHADYASFKWPLADYKNFLARKCEKLGVKILLNTEATAPMLEAEGYDHVLVAIGPTFTKPNLPGVDGPNVKMAMEVFGHEAELPKNIVIIGGSETGVETGMYLAENGHHTTVLCRQQSLASDAPHAHYQTMLEDAWLKLDEFYWIKGIKKYLAIEPDGVRYINYQGEEKKIECDLVVLATGAVPAAKECTALYGAAPKTDFIGDCFRVGNVHFAVTTAFGAANQI